MPQISQQKINRYIDALYRRYTAIREELDATKAYLAEALEGYFDPDREDVESWMDVVIADPVFVRFCAHLKHADKDSEIQQFDLWTVKNGLGILPDHIEIDNLCQFLVEIYASEKKKEDEEKLKSELAYKEQEEEKSAPTKKLVNESSTLPPNEEEKEEEPRKYADINLETIKEYMCKANKPLRLNDICDMVSNDPLYKNMIVPKGAIANYLTNNVNKHFTRVSTGLYTLFIKIEENKVLPKPPKKKRIDGFVEAPALLTGKKKAPPVVFERPESKEKELLPPPVRKNFKDEPQLKPLEVRAAKIMQEFNDDEKKFNEWCEKNGHGFVSENDKRFAGLLQQYYDEAEGWIDPKNSEDSKSEFSTFDNEKGEWDDAIDEEFVDVESIRDDY